MAAPISKFAGIPNIFLRPQCRLFGKKTNLLLKNGMFEMFPTKGSIAMSSLGKTNKLCAFAQHRSLALGSSKPNVTIATYQGPRLKLGQIVTCFTTSYVSVTCTITCCRNYCSTSDAVTDMELKKHMESLTDSFIETRELLDDARDSFGSVYFNEDLQEAEDSLNETLGRYNALLEKLSDSQKEQVMRSIGLKMEELKAQRQVIQDIIREE